MKTGSSENAGTNWLASLDERMQSFSIRGSLRGASGALVVAAATLVLLFVGIHNAWDAVKYFVFVKREEQPDSEADR